MATDLNGRTVFPPDHPEGLDELERFLESVQAPELVGPEGNRTPLPVEVYELLQEIVEVLHRGQAITVAPHDQELTTQEAADLLGISRPTLVKLLEDGQIPYTQPGRHRRVLLRDVLAYQRSTHHSRRQALDELTALSEDADLYREEITKARLQRGQ